MNDTDTPARPRPTGRQKRLQAAVRWAAWLYLVVVLAAWLVLHIASDRWWAATLLLFAPRWVLLLPALVLLPAAVLTSRRLLWPVLVAAVLVAGPVMGLCVSWPRHIGAAGNRASVRLLTCNVHGHAARPHALSQLLSDANPDLVLLQESTPQLNVALFAGGGWHVQTDGELCLASRFPIQRSQNLSRGNWTGAGAAAGYVLQTPRGELRVFNVHLASPHPQLQAVIDREGGAANAMAENSSDRWAESEAVATAARPAGSAVLVAGDFNTPPASPIFGRAWSGFSDAFSAAGFGYGFTYHTRLAAVRIDHILSAGPIRCRRCWTGPNVGSPHRPLLADFD